MPAYLCHGFRWQRRSVRVYVVVQNLDDASPEWIIPAKSSQCLLESFYNLFDFLPYCVPPPRSGQGNNSLPLNLDSDDDSYVFSTAAYSSAARSRSRSQSLTQGGQSQQRSRSQSRSLSRQQSNAPAAPPPPVPRSAGSGASVQGGGDGDDVRAQDWSVVKLLEEYDPMNLDEVSRPYAYVADYVVRVDLSVGIVEEIQRYEERVRADRDPPMTAAASDETGRKKSNKKPGWFEKLRDQLQRGEEIRWYVVVNGDEVRDWPDEPDKKPDAALRPTPTPQQQQHHAQYTHQQLIFEGNDSRRPKRPSEQRLYEVPRRAEMKPTVPDKDLPTLRPKMSMDGSGRPPNKGGLRRLFGSSRNKPDDYSP